MNIYDCTTNKRKNFHFNDIDRGKLESLLPNDEEIIKVIYGMTNHGWDITSYKFKVNISNLAKQLNYSRAAIRQEIIRGLYEVRDRVDKPAYYIYLAQTSSAKRRDVVRNLEHRKIKLEDDEKLQTHIRYYRRTKKWSFYAIWLDLELNGWFGFKIGVCFKTFYNWISSDIYKRLNIYKIFKYKNNKKKIKPTKRQIGPSIEMRPEVINKRKTYGHLEVDLIEGARKTLWHLLTIIDRKARKGWAIKIKGKNAKAVVEAFIKLQSEGKLIYGKNVNSITFDNGPEFSSWQEICKSLQTMQLIDAYFCHSYCSWEKGSIENFNRMIRRFFPKGTNFTNISQEAIDDVVEWINNYPRKVLNGKTANEIYNSYVLTN